MNALRRAAAWLGTLVVLANLAIFVLIASRYLANPIRAAAEFGITLATPAGANSMRVGFGAFPLAYAALLAAALLARRRLVALAMTATVMGTAAIVRAAGLALDGPSPESLRLLAPEIVLFALSLACAAIERSGGRPGRAAGPPRPRPEPRVASAADRTRRRAGGGLLVAIVVVLASSALAKLAGVPAVVAQLRGWGFAGLEPLVGALELASAGLLAVALTRPAGLAFASAFFGGAIATHLQHEHSPRVLVPALLLALLWLGAWLRHPRLAAAGGAEGREPLRASRGPGLASEPARAPGWSEDARA